MCMHTKINYKSVFMHVQSMDVYRQTYFQLESVSVIYNNFSVIPYIIIIYIYNYILIFWVLWKLV